MNAPFALEIGLTLCLQITAVVAVTFGLQTWLRDARSSCRLWTVCFLVILGLTAAAILLPHRRLYAFHGSWNPEFLVQVVVWQTRLVFVIATIWISGVVYLLLRRALSYWELRKFLQDKCHDVSVASQLKMNQAAAPALQFSTEGDRRLTKLQLMTSTETQVPFCWQLHRPVIVLPHYLLAENDVIVGHVLQHEIEHLRSQHPMQLFLQGFCSTVFWFHPAVWWAANQADLCREFLCDEVVAAAGGKVADYLRTLARIAERCVDALEQVPHGALAFGKQKNALIRRSDRLVDLAQTPQRTTKPWRCRLALVALVLVAILVNQVWLPTNVIASTRSDWSPWPHWTADALYSFDIRVRDFEPFDERAKMHELLKH